MKHLRISFIMFLLCIGASYTQAQSKKRSFNFNKGNVIDILLLTKNPGADEKIKDYFKTAIPIAEEAGYHNISGFRIDENIPQGNYQPDVLAIGYWDNINGREKFLKEVKTKIPDFHQVRMDIWSTFYLTHYELKQDLSFEIDTEKFNVVTAYWKKDDDSFQKFRERWVRETQKAEGKIKFAPEDGKSPFGYYYKPDYFEITEWESEEAFNKFIEKNLADPGSVKHVNQFILN